MGAPGTVGYASGMARSKQDSARSTPEDRGGSDTPNPVWFVPVMLGFMLLGLAWIIVYYLSNGVLPIDSLDNWNVLIGFGIMLIGFLMTTRWR